jgi:hypothetical protein
MREEASQQLPKRSAAIAATVTRVRNIEQSQGVTPESLRLIKQELMTLAAQSDLSRWRIFRRQRREVRGAPVYTDSRRTRITDSRYMRTARSVATQMRLTITPPGQ